MADVAMPALIPQGSHSEPVLTVVAFVLVAGYARLCGAVLSPVDCSREIDP